MEFSSFAGINLTRGNEILRWDQNYADFRITRNVFIIDRTC